MRIINKKAKFNYQLFDRLEAGLVLTGPEVKSIRAGKISLTEAYVRFIKNQLWLVGANISPYLFADNQKYDPTRTRQLLVHKKELLSLMHKMEAKKQILVPTAIYTKGRRIKLEIALAKSKKLWQKKEVKKQADIDRETERILADKK